MDFKQQIAALISAETKLPKELVLSKIETPPDPKLGDFAFPCFELAKSYKKNPVQIAKDLAAKLKPPKGISKIEAAGPYLNFFVDMKSAAKQIIQHILKEKSSFGKGKKKKEMIGVEYVSPNTNKSLHLGHVRNGMLGSSLSNILKFDGFKVVRLCLNNDRGVGMSEAMLGYLMFHNNEQPKIKPDHFVAQCYVDFKKAEVQNPNLKQKAEELLIDWENGKKDVIQLWKKMTNWVYKGYKETYDKLGIKFDKQYYESQIYREGKDIVMSGLKRGIFQKKEGAIIAKLDPLPNKVLIKSDGTSLYMTQDIYLAKLKVEDFKLDCSIYVVASEQDNHFQQLFKILDMLSYKFAKKCYHLSYGLVNLPSGRMKSREGNVVDADDLIEEVISVARSEIIKRHPSLGSKEIQKRAEMIGIGALKFFMLKFDNITSFVYIPEESLSFEGETGPYVQYAHARICSILAKAGKFPPKVEIFEKGDEKLIILLSKFPETVKQAAGLYKPHILARYLLDLAQAFNEFYHSCPILQAETKLRNSRINLISAVKQVLSNGLSLLGIEAPEEM